MPSRLPDGLAARRGLCPFAVRTLARPRSLIRSSSSDIGLSKWGALPSIGRSCPGRLGVTWVEWRRPRWAPVLETAKAEQGPASLKLSAIDGYLEAADSSGATARRIA